MSPFLDRPIAHRGLHDKKLIIENSLEAFENAMEHNLAIECDIVLSKDKEIIVFHDYDLKRMCGINSNISDLSTNEIRKLKLLDTECKGNTQGLVEIFLNKLRRKDFEVFFENEFAVATNNSITNFLERKYEDFENNFIELSKKTFDNFQEMIPSNFKKLWTDGIENEDYYLKLCGSGGGGFLIGFTRDIDTIDKYFPKKNFEVLLRF